MAMGAWPAWSQSTPTYGIDVSFSNPSPIVNSNETVTITVTDAGVPQGNVAVSMEVKNPDGSASYYSSIKTDSNGHAVFNAMTSKSAGTHDFIVSVGGSQVKTSSLAVAPDAPTKLTMQPIGNVLIIDGAIVLPSDGNCVLKLVSKLTDQYGNPISNANITFNTSDSLQYSNTDNTGTTGIVQIGPYYYATTKNITASYSTLTSDTFVARFANCGISLTTNASTVTVGSEVIARASVSIDGEPCPGIPVTFKLYYQPDMNKISTPVDVSTNDTDYSGDAEKTETISNYAGNNFIIASVEPMGLVSTYQRVLAVNGTDTNLYVSYSAMGRADSNGNALADGYSKYSVTATLRDGSGNPIQGVDINFTDEDGNQVVKPTSLGSGAATISSTTSSYVRVLKLNIATVNNCSQTINLSFVAGPASRIFVKSSPNVIASSDVMNISAPHTTTVSAFVTDDWYHPVAGWPVNFSVLSGPGTITGPASGTTDSSGTANTVFTLNHSRPDSAMITPDSPYYPYYAIAKVQAQIATCQGTPQSAVATITYTNNSFLSVQTNITPTNATLHKPITVYVNVTGIGWQVNSTPVDAFILVDKSGSMNWLSHTASGYPQKFEIPSGTDYTDNSQWYPIGTYTLDNRTTKSFDTMLSWNFNNNNPYSQFDPGNTYYLLKIVMPDNKTILEPTQNGARLWDNTSDTTYNHAYPYPGYIAGMNSLLLVYNVDNVNGVNGLNAYDYPRDYWNNPINLLNKYPRKYNNRLPSGDYKIYAFYNIGSKSGPSPGYLTVETTDIRENSAINASVAFVNDVSSYNSVGLITFGTGASIDQPITSMNDSNDRQNLINKIESITPGGETDTFMGINEAINNFPNDTAKHAIVLVTDGFSYNPAWDLSNASLAAQKGVAIHTVGIGTANMSLLGEISNMTGGSSYYAENETELTEIFSKWAKDLQPTIADNTTLSVISDRSEVNNTYYNNTEYIPNSALVSNTTNTTPHHVEPIIKVADNGYQLIWYPGEIRINDFWDLEYKLMVNGIGENGFIQPITNNSSISFIRPNTTDPIVVNLDGNTVFVSNNTSGMGKTIKVTLAYPDNSTDPVYNDTIIIKWTVEYNGTGRYHQFLNYSYENDKNWTPIGPPLPDTLQGADAASSPKSWEYRWNVKGLPYGRYEVQVIASDYDDDSNPACGTFMRDSDNGQIILR